jgi:hypothetical protein
VLRRELYGFFDRLVPDFQARLHQSSDARLLPLPDQPPVRHDHIAGGLPLVLLSKAACSAIGCRAPLLLRLSCSSAAEIWRCCVIVEAFGSATACVRDITQLPKDIAVAIDAMESRFDHDASRKSSLATVSAI